MCVCRDACNGKCNNDDRPQEVYETMIYGHTAISEHKKRVLLFRVNDPTTNPFVSYRVSNNVLNQYTDVYVKNIWFGRKRNWEKIKQFQIITHIDSILQRYTVCVNIGVYHHPAACLSDDMNSEHPHRRTYVAESTVNSTIPESFGNITSDNGEEPTL